MSFRHQEGWPVLESRNHRRIVWLCVAMVAALTWWQLSKQEAEKAKPDRDYAYFIVNTDPRIVRGGAVGLTILATGILRDVQWAVQTTADHDRLAINYIYSNEYSVVGEEGRWSGIYLPPGDYTFDVDPPSKLGKVRERLKITQSQNGGFVGDIVYVRRKFGDRDLLIPSPPMGMVPLFHKLIVGFYAAMFLVFSVTLGRVSS